VLCRLRIVRRLSESAYFLPDFLMPWEPVFMGPLLLPTLPASSSRAFLSVVLSAAMYDHATIWYARLRGCEAGSDVREMVRTGSELSLVREVILIELLRLLLGLLVVDGVGTGYFARNVSMVPVFDPAICDCEARRTYLLVLKAYWRFVWS
jgi:hypothetical protein